MENNTMMLLYNQFDLSISPYLYSFSFQKTMYNPVVVPNANFGEQNTSHSLQMLFLFTNITSNGTLIKTKEEEQIENFMDTKDVEAGKLRSEVFD